jgi:predicted glycosyltransferase involved in capsule biosynthesis
MIPEKGCDYSFPEKYPIHIATNISQMEYKLKYQEYVGGAVLFSKEQVEKTNGYSNDYWDWGMEDDDLFWRCALTNNAEQHYLNEEFTPLLSGQLTNIHPTAANNMLLKEAQWFSVDHAQVGHYLRDVFENYKGYAEKAKRQGYYSRTNFSFEKMKEKLDSIFKERIPEFPKQVQLQLPKLKKIELPKLSKIETK